MNESIENKEVTPGLLSKDMIRSKEEIMRAIEKSGLMKTPILLSHLEALEWVKDGKDVIFRSELPTDQSETNGIGDSLSITNSTRTYARNYLEKVKEKIISDEKDPFGLFLSQVLKGNMSELVFKEALLERSKKGIIEYSKLMGIDAQGLFDKFEVSRCEYVEGINHTVVADKVNPSKVYIYSSSSKENNPFATYENGTVIFEPHSSNVTGESIEMTKGIAEDYIRICKSELLAPKDKQIMLEIQTQKNTNERYFLQAFLVGNFQESLFPSGLPPDEMTAEAIKEYWQDAIPPEDMYSTEATSFVQGITPPEGVIVEVSIINQKSIHGRLDDYESVLINAGDIEGGDAFISALVQKTSVCLVVSSFGRHPLYAAAIDHGSKAVLIRPKLSMIISPEVIGVSKLGKLQEEASRNGVSKIKVKLYSNGKTGYAKLIK